MKTVLALLLCLTLTFPAPAEADTPITYTVEPFLGGVFGANVTQQQFGGRYCPCAKIDYIPDGFHNQQGADAINAVASRMRPVDTLMGFSLGVQVISLYLSQHSLPAGVKVLLAGDTMARNQQLIDQHAGIPWTISNPVTMVVNEFDGWSDSPMTPSNPNWYLAWQNAVAGTQRLHYYANANPDDPANITTKRGNVTSVLIPTQTLPLNGWLRPWNGVLADKLDGLQRPEINNAYAAQRGVSTPSARAAASSQQVPYPNPPWQQQAEPAASN